MHMGRTQERKSIIDLLMNGKNTINTQENTKHSKKPKLTQHINGTVKIWQTMIRITYWSVVQVNWKRDKSSTNNYR